MLKSNQNSRGFSKGSKDYFETSNIRKYPNVSLYLQGVKKYYILSSTQTVSSFTNFTYQLFHTFVVFAATVQLLQ